jgi:hypothetical protein
LLLVRLGADEEVDEVAEVEEGGGDAGGEGVEQPEVLLADALAEPGAVVVVLLDADVAVLAVVDPPGDEHLADVAVAG